MAKKGHTKGKSNHTAHKVHHIEHHPAHHTEHHTEHKTHPAEHHAHHVEHHPTHHVKHHPVHTQHHPTPVTINMPAPKETQSNNMLVENFVSLQRVMTNLAIKLDEVSSNISKLLEIFEISAKALAEKDFDVEKDNKEILEKLNGLVDQNRILARGMALMHERIPREQFVPQIPFQPQPQMPQYQQNSATRDMTSENIQQGFQPSMMQEQESQSSPQRPPFESPI